MVHRLGQTLGCVERVHRFGGKLRLGPVVERTKKSSQDASLQARASKRAQLAAGLSVEAQLAGTPATAKYCHGDSPTVADIFLVPQVYNSQRPVVGADLSKWPTINRIYATCIEYPAFERSLPKNQPGFESPKEH